MVFTNHPHTHYLSSHLLCGQIQAEEEIRTLILDVGIAHAMVPLFFLSRVMSSTHIVYLPSFHIPYSTVWPICRKSLTVSTVVPFFFSVGDVLYAADVGCS